MLFRSRAFSGRNGAIFLTFASLFAFLVTGLALQAAGLGWMPEGSAS
jgi:hypothetical protein